MQEHEVSALIMQIWVTPINLVHASSLPQNTLSNPLANVSEDLRFWENQSPLLMLWWQIHVPITRIFSLNLSGSSTLLDIAYTQRRTNGRQEAKYKINHSYILMKHWSTKQLKPSQMQCSMESGRRQHASTHIHMILAL